MFDKVIDYIKNAPFFRLAQHACLIVLTFYMLNSGSLLVKKIFNFNINQKIPKEILKYNSIAHAYLEKYIIFILIIAFGLLIIGLTLTIIQPMTRYEVILIYASGLCDSGKWLMLLVGIHYIYRFSPISFIVITVILTSIVRIIYDLVNKYKN
ncbi:hypothetical protein ABE244_07035 [Bacillus toyonensis]|uniref:hypothetical protein n=1 Tax=Bacillus toyonensis TaxID=155322 RepID=UPI003D1A821B